MIIRDILGNLIFNSLGSIDLRNANLTNADLSNANLTNANLINADLSNADLRGANFKTANLRNANLKNANIWNTNLKNANLWNANLTNANLTNANLTNANLTNANLTNANLTNADLSNANLSNTNFNKTLGVFCTCPKSGEIIGWKKINHHIIRLKIPKWARRTAKYGSRKCRAEYAIVEKIFHGLNEVDSVSGGFDKNFKYSVGCIVKPDFYDASMLKECTNGIHFFMTREEAEQY